MTVLKSQITALNKNFFMVELLKSQITALNKNFFMVE